MKDDKNDKLETKGEDFQGTASDFDFLQEKIKERPVNKKKLLKRTLMTASLAVLFGLLACLSFLLLEPVLNNWLYPEEEPEVVTFPQEKNEMLPEDMLTEGTTTGQEESDENSETAGVESSSSDEHETDGTTAESSREDTDETSSEEAPDIKPDESPGGEASDKEASDKENSSKENSGGEKTANEEGQSGETPDMAEGGDVIEPLKPYQTQYEELYNVYREVESSMVTVTGVRSDVDWFNNTYQSEGSTAGVIIANNNRELLILSRKSPLDGAETIRIKFCNNVSADASLKQYDKNTNLAVLAVDLKYLAGNTLGQVSVAVLGSSAFKGATGTGITGTPVIAIGNLFGYKDTVCYGIVTSNGNVISMVDNEYKLITTDIYAGTNPRDRKSVV